MTPQHPDEGRRRKSEAHALLETRRAPLIREARRALLGRLLMHSDATFDSIRSAVPLPAGVNPATFGAVPGPLVRAGIIRKQGYVESLRPETHARILTVWQLADRAAALRWLADNPPLQLDSPTKKPGELTPGI